MREVLETALEAARAAASVHRAHLGRVSIEDWSEKGAADFVTHVDRAAEAGIVNTVRERFPDHTILAEESAGIEGRNTAPPNGWAWVIDPLDGTTNFLHGYPMYAVSIGVVQDGQLAAGVVVNSASGEEWTAGLGAGAFRNGERIHASPLDGLERALIGTGFPFKALGLLPEYQAQFAAVLRAASDVRRAGSAALDLCHVASGFLDGFWELSLAPWDVAAGTLIVREAGGVVTRLDGSTDVIGDGSILAGNPVIHGLLGTLLESVRNEAKP